VNPLEALADVAVLIASRRPAAQAAGRESEETLWRYLRALSDFVHVTGQLYRFEDFFQGTAPTGSPPSTHEGTLAQPAMELLRKTLDETSGSEQQSVRVLMTLLDFMASTGQSAEVENFFTHPLEYAPVAIAHFTHREEVESWLKGVAPPPSPSRILIGDEDYQLWYMREDHTHGMYRDHAIEPAMEALTARGIPPETPSFATRAAAEEWLKSHPAKPYALVAIAGEYYFAVHHRRLRRHSLHHVASALTAWEEHKKVIALETSSTGSND